MVVDIIILVLLFSAVMRGRDIGFVQQIFSTVGFIGGLLLGAYILPFTLPLAHTALSRSLVTLLTIMGTALITLSMGEYIGMRTKHKVTALKDLNRLDNVLGAIISFVSVLIGIWLGVAILRTLPYISFQQYVNNSRIIAMLDRYLPPAPNVIADLSHLVDPNGFPRVFIGSEPAPKTNVTLPPYSAIAAAVTRDAPSVVKIIGNGCGGIVEGSGFVVKPDMVATNAHVVAGIGRPYVEDNNGNHPATVIYFNPNLDFALLKVNDLAGGPLSVSNGVAADNTDGAVMGYPGGGGLKADAAVIMQHFMATGSNIYDQGVTNRNVYELAATIIPGNSGGPLINTAGTVVGVVFAESTQYNGVGYALVSQPLNPIIGQYSSASPPVSSGTCTNQ